jgi:hypothetical protein
MRPISIAAWLAAPGLMVITMACGSRTALDDRLRQNPSLAFDSGSVLESGTPLDAAAETSVSCTPVLADDLLLPGSLVLDTSAVYWAEGSPGGTAGPTEIQWCSKSGCLHQFPMTLVPDASNAGSLTVDATHAYWAEPGLGIVEVCDTSACSPSTLVALDDPPVYVAVDEDDVYIGSYNSLSMCPKSGCTAVTVLAPLQEPPLGIALDASNLYFLDQTGTGAIRACSKPLCTGGPRTVVQGTFGYALAVDDTNVYFCTGAGASEADTAGAVWSCPKTGCTAPTVLAMGLHHPGSLAVDASRVYWADQGTDANGYADGDVESCPKTGCVSAPKVHASGQSLPASVAVDGACVYWADYTTSSSSSPTGSIQSVHK